MKRMAWCLAALLPLGPAVAQKATAQPAQAAPDLNLRIERYASSTGRDGVQRESRYTDLMVRRAGSVWIERDFPAALRASDEHGHDAHEQGGPEPHAGHSHADTVGSPLWLQRDTAGKVAVRMVLRKQRKVLDIDEANYGNVGYNGSWDITYGVVDPASLKRMQPDGAPAKGVQRYRLARGESMITVDWDMKGQYARRVETRGPHGLSVNRITVTAAPAPAVLPWKAVEGYERGDYSDLLD
ncbi:hypothetical protein [Pigmentiphaga sp.]|uniref:hypothetical protein n=1 Tax=Pigmentiphaga sp. TaxID=1977564 RepID=UPI0025E83E0E|nr:hypothetical protein [Pigmentiphaga sp.]